MNRDKEPAEAELPADDCADAAEAEAMLPASLAFSSPTASI
jgi:hypothetical protein